MKFLNWEYYTLVVCEYVAIFFTNIWLYVGYDITHEHDDYDLSSSVVADLVKCHFNYSIPV